MEENPLFRVAYFLASPLARYFSKSIYSGAQTTLHCALVDYDKLEGGAYYRDCSYQNPFSFARNEAEAEKLYKTSEKLVNEAVEKMAKKWVENIDIDSVLVYVWYRRSSLFFYIKELYVKTKDPFY